MSLDVKPLAGHDRSNFREKRPDIPVQGLPSQANALNDQFSSNHLRSSELAPVRFGAARPQKFQEMAIRRVGLALNERLSDWKSTVDPDYKSFIPDFELATKDTLLLLPENSLAGAYLGTTDKMIYSAQAAYTGYPIEQLASHEGFHALSNIKRRHLAIHDNSIVTPLIIDELISRITDGESMPKLLAGFDFHVDPKEKPPFDITEADIPTLEVWSGGAVKILLSSSKFIDPSSYRLTDAGKEKLISLMTPDVTDLLKRNAPHLSPQEAVVQGFNYQLTTFKRMSPKIVDKPYLPTDFRRPLADCMRQILTQPDRYTDRPSWEVQRINDHGKKQIKALLDHPAAAEFIQQFGNTDEAEKNLLTYADSIYYRFYIADRSTHTKLPSAKEQALGKIPLTAEKRDEGIKAVKGLVSTLEGNLMVILSSLVTQPEYKLAYSLVAYEERKAREESYRFHLDQVNKELDIFAKSKAKMMDMGTFKRISELKTQKEQLTNNLTMMPLLDRFVDLMRQMDIAPASPETLEKIRTLESTQQELKQKQSELKQLQSKLSERTGQSENETRIQDDSGHVVISSSRVLDPEETRVFMELKDIKQQISQNMQSLRQLRQPDQRLADTPANQLLKDQYFEVLNKLQALYPKCTKELQQDYSPIQQLGPNVGLSGSTDIADVIGTLDLSQAKKIRIDWDGDESPTS